MTLFTANYSILLSMFRDISTALYTVVCRRDSSVIVRYLCACFSAVSSPLQWPV